MNTPNNRRKKESIERIEKAFIELLQSRPLNQISVSELCKRARLNRTTFYANYADVYALADSIRDKLEKSFAQLYASERGQSFNSNDYLKLFRHIYHNQLLCQTYFKLGYDNDYKIVTYDAAQAQAHFHNRFLNYHMEFFRAGITKIIKMWLDGGCQETPEEMFEVLQSEYRGRELPSPAAN